MYSFIDILKGQDHGCHQPRFRPLIGILALLFVVAMFAPVSAGACSRQSCDPYERAMLSAGSGEPAASESESGIIHTLNPGDSIQQNISSAVAGDIIVLNPGTYNQHSIGITKSITIRANTSYGGTAANTIIDAQNIGRIFDNSIGAQSLTIDNLTLRNGHADFGGAINSGYSSLTVTSCTFSGCSAHEYSGAIESEYGTASVVSSQFTGCSVTDSGGYGGAIGSWLDNNFTIISSSFSGNVADSGSAIDIENSAAGIHFSRILGAGTRLLTVNSTVGAENNWWGTNNNPSGFTSGAATVSPWLELDASAMPASVTTIRTSGIRANLTRNSADVDTTGGGIFVPAGIPVAFARTGGTGTVSPHAGNLTSGTNTTTFTPVGTGTCTVSATVDGVTATADITVVPVPVSRIGIYLDGVWALDNDSSFSWNEGDRAYTFGGLENSSVTGDWDDDDLTEIGVFSSGAWYLDYNGNGAWDGPVTDRAYSFGSAGDNPVTGDWNGDGADEIGVQLNGIWAVDFNGNGTWDGTTIDRYAALGQAGDIPVIGDWNGDGSDEIGSHLDGFWAVDYNGNYQWDGTTDDRFAGLGQADDKPVIGDWNGDGMDEIGMETGGFWAVDYNSNYIWDGIGDDRFAGLGQAGDTPVVGDWDGNGKTEICSFTDGFWAVDYNGNFEWDGTVDDRFAGFGSAGAAPVTGVWS